MDVKTRYPGIYPIWNDLPQEKRIELVAKARAEDTMRAWESHLMEKK